MNKNNTPTRVQLSRKRGFRLPKNTVNVARPSKWGNPFVAGPDRTQSEAVWAFRMWLTMDGVSAGLQSRKQWILDHLHELRGRNLACWCRITDDSGHYVPCHADILIALANGMTRHETLTSPKRIRHRRPGATQSRVP